MADSTNLLIKESKKKKTDIDIAIDKMDKILICLSGEEGGIYNILQ